MTDRDPQPRPATDAGPGESAPLRDGGEVDRPPLLEVTDLRKSFGGIVAVDDMSFELEAGTITGLIGPNGAGKTTTFNLVSGFYTPDSGTIRYDGTDIQELMTPGRDQQLIWSGGAGISAGVLGLGVGGVLGFGPAMLGASAAAGAGAGVAAYFGQNTAKQRLEGHRYARPHQLAQAGMVRTFQITRELGELTVLENLLLAPLDQAGVQLVNTWFRRDAIATEEERNRERAEGLLEDLELSHLRDERAANLSGGQRKLLELGRVLMLDPDLIMLDEPVAGVNPALTDRIMEKIRSLRDEGYGFCVVEHDMDVIMALSDRVIVMSQGRKLMEGLPEEVREDEAVLEAYLGG
jgi:branched-chain amino acid transport system ATP-binding protein